MRASYNPFPSPAPELMYFVWCKSPSCSMIPPHTLSALPTLERRSHAARAPLACRSNATRNEARAPLGRRSGRARGLKEMRASCHPSQPLLAHMDSETTRILLCNTTPLAMKLTLTPWNIAELLRVPLPSPRPSKPIHGTAVHSERTLLALAGAHGVASTGEVATMRRFAAIHHVTGGHGVAASAEVPPQRTSSMQPARSSKPTRWPGSTGSPKPTRSQKPSGLYVAMRFSSGRWPAACYNTMQRIPTPPAATIHATTKTTSAQPGACRRRRTRRKDTIQQPQDTPHLNMSGAGGFPAPLGTPSG